MSRHDKTHSSIQYIKRRHFVSEEVLAFRVLSTWAWVLESRPGDSRMTAWWSWIRVQYELPTKHHNEKATTTDLGRSSSMFKGSTPPPYPATRTLIHWYIGTWYNTFKCFECSSIEFVFNDVFDIIVSSSAGLCQRVRRDLWVVCCATMRLQLRALSIFFLTSKLHYAYTVSWPSFNCLI